MGGNNGDWGGPAHHDDVDLTPDENLRIEAIRLAENPDLAPVPVVEEQPPAKQNGRAQLRVALYFAALAAYVITLYLLATLGGRA